MVLTIFNNNDDRDGAVVDDGDEPVKASEGFLKKRE